MILILSSTIIASRARFSSSSLVKPCGQWHFEPRHQPSCASLCPRSRWHRDTNSPLASSNFARHCGCFIPRDGLAHLRLSPLADRTSYICTANCPEVPRADASCVLLHPSRYTTSGFRTPTCDHPSRRSFSISAKISWQWPSCVRVKKLRSSFMPVKAERVIVHVFPFRWHDRHHVNVVGTQLVACSLLFFPCGVAVNTRD